MVGDQREAPHIEILVEILYFIRVYEFNAFFSSCA